MPNIIIGQNYYHKTLGLVKAIQKGNTMTVVRILTPNLYIEDWMDDWGNHFRVTTTHQSWWVKDDYLTSIDESQLTKEQIIHNRIKKLWNESNYVKANSKRAY